VDWNVEVAVYVWSVEYLRRRSDSLLYVFLDGSLEYQGCGWSAIFDGIDGLYTEVIILGSS
jgi:hypothetical protein